MRSIYRMRRLTGTILLYTVLIIFGIAYCFPFVWMVLSSFKYTKDVLAVPIKFFPPEWNWQSYYRGFTFGDYDFPRYTLNSLLVTVSAVLLCIFLSTTAGYGFSKYTFRGHKVLFVVILATMMIPFEAIIVPLFILTKQLGLQNTYWALIIPEGLTAFGVFMMRQFFYSVPIDTIEYARIEGAGEIRIFYSIALPLSSTAILALVIFHAQWVWNLLIWPLVAISTPELRTLPQAIALFSGVYETPYPEQLAVSVISCLPILVLFLFLSKYFVQGIALTGMKA